jgi:hypothetical protein
MIKPNIVLPSNPTRIAESNNGHHLFVDDLNPHFYKKISSLQQQVKVTLYYFDWKEPGLFLVNFSAVVTNITDDTQFSLHGDCHSYCHSLQNSNSAQNVTIVTTLAIDDQLKVEAESVGEFEVHNSCLSIQYATSIPRRGMTGRRSSKLLAPKQCTCDVSTLFNKGCQCGGK